MKYLNLEDLRKEIEELEKDHFKLKKRQKKLSDKMEKEQEEMEEIFSKICQNIIEFTNTMNSDKGE